MGTPFITESLEDETKWLKSNRSNSGPLEQRLQNLFGFKNFARDSSGRARVFFVIRANHFGGFADIVQRFEGKEPGIATVMFGETGLLSDHRPSSGQITGAPVTEPTGVEPNILIFGYCEFALRPLDVITVKPVIHAHLQR